MQDYPNKPLTKLTADAMQAGLRIVLPFGEEIVACPATDAASLGDVITGHAPIDRVVIVMPDMAARRLLRLIADYVPSIYRDGLYDQAFTRAKVNELGPGEILINPQSPSA